MNNNKSKPTSLSTAKKFAKIVLINLLILVTGIACVFAGLELYLRWKISDPTIVKTVIDKPIYVNDPDLGWFHKPNTEFDYNGGKAFLNQFGQRSAFDTDATSRLLMLGDSFTFGMNVGQNQTMSAFMEEKLPKEWNVMNAGVIGYSIRQELIYLRREFEKLKPQVVVLNVFVGNDLTEQRRSEVVREPGDYPIRIYDKEVFVSKDGYLSSRITPPFNSILLAEIYQKWREYMMNKNAFPGYIWAVFLDKDNPNYPEDIPGLWQEYEQDLVRMKKFLDEKKVKFLVNIIPMDVQVSKTYWTKYPNKVFGEKEFALKLPQKRFQEICQRVNLDCLDLLPVFEKHTEKQLYFKEVDPHFDVDGNKLAAETLYEAISKTYPFLSQ